MGRRPNPKRRMQIIEVARELFGRDGYHNTQIADIAEALQIGHGTVYRYFQNKRDIFEQILDLEVTGFAAALQAELTVQATTLDEYEGQLRRIGQTLTDNFSTHPEGLQVVLQADSVDGEMRDRLHRAMDLFTAMSAARLQNGVDHGFLRTDLDVPVTAQLMLAATFEAVRRSAQSEDVATTGSRYVNAQLTMMIRGIAP